jgi:CheY-like chemotaxis protein
LDNLDNLDNLEPSQNCVLYIDDNPVNLKLVSRILANQKHIQLITALTPKLGIELALVNQPQLIMLDINMPEMNGFEVLEIIKSNETLKDRPIIAVTANAMAHDVERGKTAGFTDYITKPIDFDLLLKTINRHLDSGEKVIA